jgi:hypothetical protein
VLGQSDTCSHSSACLKSKSCVSWNEGKLEHAWWPLVVWFCVLILHCTGVPTRRPQSTAPQQFSFPIAMMAFDGVRLSHYPHLLSLDEKGMSLVSPHCLVFHQLQ